MQIEASNGSLSRRAERLCAAARVLARHVEELDAPAVARLLQEVGQSSEILARALPMAPPNVPADLDELLQLRCSCL